jgi:hypothetical protein
MFKRSGLILYIFFKTCLGRMYRFKETVRRANDCIVKNSQRGALATVLYCTEGSNKAATVHRGGCQGRLALTFWGRGDWSAQRRACDAAITL